MDGRLEFSGGMRAVAVVATALSWPSLAVPPPGNVAAWGWNSSGQLGPDASIDANSNVPVPVSGLSLVTTVATGMHHSLALRSNGTVWAWGENVSGNLGNGSNTDSNVPVPVSGLSSVIAVSGGGAHSLALKSDGTVRAWGDNDNGTLGNGSNTDSNVPVPVSNLGSVAAVSAGRFIGLALRSDGTVWAWGFGRFGALGNGGNTDSNLPVQVSNGSMGPVVAVAAGGTHSLALKSNGTVWAWGSGGTGELGNGSTAPYSLVPVPVGNLGSVIAVAAGGTHSLALKSDGTVWAWGSNYWGQLGNDSIPYSSVPVQVGNLGSVVAVAAGYGHSLALKADGTVWAWGDNEKGSLGNGGTSESHVPVQVSGVVNAIALGTGSYLHSVALVQPSVVDMSISPSSIALGASANLAWASTNTAACTASNAWTGAKATAGSQIVAPTIAGSYTYALSCTGAGGAASNAVKLTVIPPPSVSFTANPASIAYGESSTLSWSTIGATSCTASGAWLGSKATTGSQNVSPAVGSYTYTLNCSGAGGSTSKSATLIVNPVPTLAISVNPTTIHRFTNPKTATLTWSSTNASSCTASGSWSGAKPISGSLTITNTALLPKTETYTLTCSGPGGGVSGSATLAKKVF